MNNWILPHIQEEIDEIRKNEEQKQLLDSQQKQIDKAVNYVILDAALWDFDMDRAFSLSPEYCCLFATRGAEHELDAVAPYLFPYIEGSKFGEWLKSKEKRGLRALYISSDATLEELRKHLRRFLRVKTEEGKWLFFRFYDPNVAEITLPYLTDNQQYYFYKKINHITILQEDTSKYTILHPSIKAHTQAIEQKITLYPLMILDAIFFKQVSIAKMKKLKDEFVCRLKEQNITNRIDLNDFVNTQVDEAIRWGFKTEKECFNYLLLSFECDVLLQDTKPEWLNSILKNKDISSREKINRIKSNKPKIII